jgi:hypothetical protein
MKKLNLTITATIIATFVISMFAFQPTTTEASMATPTAMTTPRTIRRSEVKLPRDPASGRTTHGIKAKKSLTNAGETSFVGRWAETSCIKLKTKQERTACSQKGIARKQLQKRRHHN